MSNQKSEISVNPFSVKTPENLSANELVDLFVPYPEFENLQVGGHQFLHGHRGSGKSMMLRMMSPDSQMLWRGCQFDQLPYFGVYLSIKATELSSPEYSRIESAPNGTVITEHILTTKLLSALFSSFKLHCVEHVKKNNNDDCFFDVVDRSVISKLRYAGWSGKFIKDKFAPAERVNQVYDFLIEMIDEIHSSTVQYIKRCSYETTGSSYQGVLLGFQDVLLPIIKSFTNSNIIPKAPVYFLLDDADNLTLQQTKILNSWVSYRTTDYVSLKISTQLNYKTYKTTSNIKIESPHDFSAINFTAVQTGSIKERYPQLISEIVSKRLSKYGCTTIDPYLFFPEDESQKDAIIKIGEELKKKWAEGDSGAYRAGDDAYRYARPEYIRRLSGASKQGSTYRYAGFEQLVHVSSGIIRFFLEPAARMFTEELLRCGGGIVEKISPAIQDQELRNQANQLLLQEFDDLLNEDGEADQESIEEELNDIVRLRNIVQGVGALFRSYIMDESGTQRRVFSFSISGEVSPKLKKILKLGVSHGYFYLGSIGSKNGAGRVTLYVLTRRLAPAFSLDPMGFSGYLTVTNSLLLEISEKPSAVINRIRTRGADDMLNSPQLSLLDGDINE